MGLRDDITTLEAQREAGQEVSQKLALAYAEMIVRKGSKRLISAWYDALADLLGDNHRFQELVRAAGGVNPDELGIWDIQAAVRTWLESQTK